MGGEGILKTKYCTHVWSGPKNNVLRAVKCNLYSGWHICFHCLGGLRGVPPLSRQHHSLPLLYPFPHRSSYHRSKYHYSFPTDITDAAHWTVLLRYVWGTSCVVNVFDFCVKIFVNCLIFWLFYYSSAYLNFLWYYIFSIVLLFRNLCWMFSFTLFVGNIYS